MHTHAHPNTHTNAHTETHAHAHVHTDIHRSGCRAQIHSLVMHEYTHTLPVSLRHALPALISDLLVLQYLSACLVPLKELDFQACHPVQRPQSGKALSKLLSLQRHGPLKQFSSIGDPINLSRCIPYRSPSQCALEHWRLLFKYCLGSVGGQTLSSPASSAAKISKFLMVPPCTSATERGSWSPKDSIVLVPGVPQANPMILDDFFPIFVFLFPTYMKMCLTRRPLGHLSVQFFKALQVSHTAQVPVKCHWVPIKDVCLCLEGKKRGAGKSGVLKSGVSCSNPE